MEVDKSAVGHARAEVSAAHGRGAFLERGLAAGAALAGGAVVAAGLPRLASSAPSQEQRQILNFALLVDEMSAAFYRRASAGGALSGELAQYAEVAGGHERAHAARLRTLLGSAASAAPAFDFGSATASAKAFRSAAIQIEELALGYLNGQAPHLSGEPLDAVLEIVSVEARHAAWIRDIAGERPAPVAADQPIGPAHARARLRATGFVSA